MTARPLRRARRAAVALALGAGLLLAVGCSSDGGDGADLDAGKQTFASMCSSCHTLEAAGTPPASIGPNLDDSFRASREVGMDDEQFAGLVERWIRIAQLPMPRDLVEGQDARNVAAYIASVAGTNPESDVYPAVTSPEVPDPPRQEQE